METTFNKTELFALAMKYYRNHEEVADYTYNDALFDAADELDIELPDPGEEKDYDELVDEFLWNMDII